MKFIALGDTDDVAASCHYLQIEGSGLVLDAGVDPRRDGQASVPAFEVVHNDRDRYIDHALITHAHHDHIGALPVLIDQFPHVNAHMTDATKQLIEFLLPASARLQRRRVEQGETDAEPLFSEDDLHFHSHMYLTHDLGEAFDVTGLAGTSEVQARFYTAGHILGSIGVELSFQENGEERQLFYTSDTNMQPQSILPGADYPDETDILVLESTLGDDVEAERTSRPEEVARLKESLTTILERGGTALIPVFVMGRAQETLAILGAMKDQGEIDDDVPIYTAGSLRAISDLYDQTRLSTPRLDPDFRVFDVNQKRVPRSSDGKDDAFDGPCICVVSSGMMFEPTLSNVLARRMVENERDGILLVGYAKEDTPADRLLQAKERGPGSGVLLHPERGPQPLRCMVEKFRLTGHSNRRDLLAIARNLDPEHVILVHGEPAAREWMAKNIHSQMPHVEIHVPDGQEVVTV
jgi:Cft2 family RNA processing exonuclease